MDAVLVIKVKGYAWAITVIDFVVKNAYVKPKKIYHEKVRGELNIIFVGSVGQISEAESLFKDFAKRKYIDYKVSKLLNFDVNLMDLDKDYIDI